MSNDDHHPSFLGTGWSFPPRFLGSGAAMSADEQDIHESLILLFGTTAGERMFQPKYGLDLHELMFEPVSTSMRTLLLDRVRTAILIYEPRIRIVSLSLNGSDPEGGILEIALEYLVRATNSRYNLVFPFYQSDSNERRQALASAGPRG